MALVSVMLNICECCPFSRDLVFPLWDVLYMCMCVCVWGGGGGGEEEGSGDLVYPLSLSLFGMFCT